MKSKQLLTLFLVIVSGNIIALTTLPQVLNCNTNLTLAQSPYLVQTRTTLLTGCQLTVEAGVEIQMSDFSTFTIKGKAEFLGTESQPIRIHAQNLNWGNIFLNKASGHCKFNYVIISDATFTPHHTNTIAPPDTNLQRAAFSSYYSSTEVNHCTFKNNQQCIYAKYGTISVNGCSFDSTNVKEKINIQFVRGALVENSFFSRSYGLFDMVDFDGVKNGIIRNNNMFDGEDDGIDIGEWESNPCDTVFVSNNHIEGMLYGKGISIGEGSKNIRVERNEIINCGIGIAVKDDSEASIINNTLNADSIGVDLYEKTVGWGGGIADVKNTIIANSYLSSVKTDVLSTLTISYSLSNTNTLPGNSNKFGDPLFVSIPLKKFYIKWNSPAKNAGDPTSPLDPDNSRNDIGAYPFDSTALIGINEYAYNSNEMELYPNPTTGNVHLKYISNSAICFISIENINGQMIYSKNNFPSTGILDETIDLKAQPKGIYFLNIETEKGRVNKKIIRL